MKSLRNITEADVVAVIDGAHNRVVLLAPGLSIPVADALSRAWSRTQSDNVSVIIDTDPEVCQLGYGSIDALKAAQASAAENGQLIAHQPGIRLCILIADQDTLVFSPMPHLIESVFKSPPEKWTSFLGATAKKTEVKETLHQTLLESFGDPQQLIRAMKVSVKFKGVTYESLKDSDFRDKAATAFPRLKLHDEFDAARGTQTELF